MVYLLKQLKINYRLTIFPYDLPLVNFLKIRILSRPIPVSFKRTHDNFNESLDTHRDEGGMPMDPYYFTMDAIIVLRGGTRFETNITQPLA
jgi:hypothetical protein